jgi:hypothetical protein
VRAVAVEGFEEELGVTGDLEDAAAVVADGGKEEGALRGGSLRSRPPLRLWARVAAEKHERRAGKKYMMTAPLQKRFFS